jgi:nucleoside-diphosphate-sugar epimerase
MLAAMRVLILGCGYVGLPLGTELVRLGHEVVGVRRSPEAGAALQAAGIQPVAADITRRADLERLPGPFDWVVNLVSSGKGGVDEYRAVYLQGTRNLLDWLAAAPPKKFVYTSSTSVYGQTDGSVVKEESFIQPASDTSKVLVETEKVLLQAARTQRFPAVILRVAGIYGPGRGHLFLQYLRDEAKLTGKGDRFINMIHLDDLVTVILAALKSGRPGEVYNAVDDEPVTQLNFFRFLAEALGKDLPPSVEESEVLARKRGLTNKRVSNRKLKMELGCPFKHANFRLGYTAEMIRMERLGQMPDDAQPD